jgi:hypothetical protein
MSTAGLGLGALDAGAPAVAGLGLGALDAFSTAGRGLGALEDASPDELETLDPGGRGASRPGGGVDSYAERATRELADRRALLERGVIDDAAYASDARDALERILRDPGRGHETKLAAVRALRDASLVSDRDAETYESLARARSDPSNAPTSTEPLVAPRREAVATERTPGGATEPPGPNARAWAWHRDHPDPWAFLFAQDEQVARQLEWQAERSRRMKARVLALAEPTVVSDAERHALAERRHRANEKDRARRRSPPPPPSRPARVSAVAAHPRDDDHPRAPTARDRRRAALNASSAEAAARTAESARDAAAFVAETRRRYLGWGRREGGGGEDRVTAAGASFAAPAPAPAPGGGARGGAGWGGERRDATMCAGGVGDEMVRDDGA